MPRNPGLWGGIPLGFLHGYVQTPAINKVDPWGDILVSTHASTAYHYGAQWVSRSSLAAVLGAGYVSSLAPDYNLVDVPDALASRLQVLQLPSADLFASDNEQDRERIALLQMWADDLDASSDLAEGARHAGLLKDEVLSDVKSGMGIWAGGKVLRWAGKGYSKWRTARRMALVRKLGRAGEAAYSITKNTARIESLTGTAAYRTPDILDRAAKVIGEVKNVQNLDLTSQIVDDLLYAQKYNYDFVLLVRPSTVLSGPLQEALKLAGATINLLP